MSKQLEYFLYLLFKRYCLELISLLLWKHETQDFHVNLRHFSPPLQELVMITCFPVDRAIPSPLQSILKKG